MIATALSRLALVISVIVAGLYWAPIESTGAASRPTVKTIATGLTDLPCRSSVIAAKNNVAVIAYLNDGAISTRRTINGGLSWESVRTISPAGNEDLYNTNVDCSVQITATAKYFYVGAYIVTEYDSPGFYQFWRSVDGKKWTRSGRIVDVSPQLTQVMIAATKSTLHLAGVSKIIGNPECLIDESIVCEISFPLKVIEIPEATMIARQPIELDSSTTWDETEWAGFAIAGGDSVVVTWSNSIEWFSAFRASANTWRTPSSFVAFGSSGVPVETFYEARVSIAGKGGLMAYSGTYDGVLRWRWTTNGGKSWGRERARNDSSWDYAMVRNVWAAGGSYRVAVERWDDSVSWKKSDVYRVSSSGAARLWTAPQNHSVVGGIYAKGRSIVLTRKPYYDPANCTVSEITGLDCDPVLYAIYGYTSP